MRRIYTGSSPPSRGYLSGFSGVLGRPPDGERHGPFKGPHDTLKAMERIALGPRGEQSTRVRQFTEWVMQGIWPKDYLGEILAARNCLVQPSWSSAHVPMFRYMNDPRHVEWIKDPERMVEEINGQGSTIVDCDEQALMAATMLLQLGREVEFVAHGYQKGSKELTHVGVRCKEPKSSRWIWIDPVAGPRERESAASAAATIFWSID